MRRTLCKIHRSEGVCAPVTGYAIPARVGVWLVWCSFRGPLVLEGLSPRRAAAAPPPLRMWGRCFSRYVSGDGDHMDAFS